MANDTRLGRRKFSQIFDEDQDQDQGIPSQMSLQKKSTNLMDVPL